MGVLQNGYLQVGFLSGWVGMKLVHPGSAPFSSWFCTVFILAGSPDHSGVCYTFECPQRGEPQ